MQHLTDDTITALALGASSAHAQHLEDCSDCRDEVTAVRAVAALLRAAHAEPVVPPPAMWDRILADITADTPGSVTAAAEVPVAAVPAPAVPAPASPGSPGSPHAPAHARPHGASGDVVRRRRRRYSARAVVAACVASAIVAASLALLVVTQVRSPGSTELADAALDPLMPIATTARAELVERDGQRVLIVDADALPTVEGYLDVWLLDPQAERMVNLGVMGGTTTELSVPADLDLSMFSVVDVSIEPYDGDPAHSGSSVWRGSFEL